MATDGDAQTSPISEEATTTIETNPSFNDLKAIAKFKARSYETSKDVHTPLLQSHTQDTPSNGPTVVLLGHSMLERMTTTGQSPNFVAPWPSPTMLDDATLARLRAEKSLPTLNRLDRVFNAGVGGDKIQNLIYRLVGDEERGLPGLLPMLARCGTVKLWVVHVGTNNLTPKHGLKHEDVTAMGVLVTSLLTLFPDSRVLMTGIFDRKDVSGELVGRANHDVEEVVEKLMTKFGSDRVFYSPCPTGIKVEEHLEDHVHLNLEGYRVWVESLFVSVVTVLG